MMENTFRSDLYFRLNVITLRIPPLRERKEDIPGLTAFLLQKHSQANLLSLITPALQDALMQHEWPGNIRELENIVRKLIVFRDADMIVRELRLRMSRQCGFDRLQSNGIGPSDGAPIKRTILEQVTRAKNEAEAAAIVAALDSTHWNRKKAATILKLDYKALLYKMKKLGIDDRMATLPVPARRAAASAGD
jgi:two-component system response regulator AtoC